MMRQRGGPGIMSTMARTAMVAGTATVVSNKVSSAGQAKAAAAQQKQAAAQQQQAETQAAQQSMAEMQQQLAAMQAQQVGTAAESAPNPMIAHLQQLAQLKEAGILSDEEFASAKAKLLAG